MIDDRRIMFSAYHQHPELLGLELRILFEPCTDASFAVLHNKAINLIRALCGTHTVEKDEVGVTTKDQITFDCQDKLALHLAKSVLMYARMKEDA